MQLRTKALSRRCNGRYSRMRLLTARVMEAVKSAMLVDVVEDLRELMLGGRELEVAKFIEARPPRGQRSGGGRRGAGGLLRRDHERRRDRGVRGVR